MTRVILAGGGTGGHLFPGIALAQGLRSLDSAVDLLFLCTDRGLDAPQLGRYGFSHEVLSAPRLTGWRSWLAFPFAFRSAVKRTGALLDARRPDAVVALGGYAGAPPVRAAAVRGIPVVLLEQNVIPGRANRYAVRFANRVYTQWQESVGRFGRHAAKVEVTGNPVREEVSRRDAAEARRSLGLDPGRRTLLVMGGSQGAGGINRPFLTGESLLREFCDRLQIVHLTGATDVEAARGVYARAGMAARVEAFSDAMAALMSAADFAVSRAGGTSIAELSALGVPAALVPYPHAAENHQWYNAQAAAQGGGAVWVEEAALAAGGLREVLERAAGPAEALAAMAARTKAMGRPDARRVVAERVLALAVEKQAL